CSSPRQTYSLEDSPCTAAARKKEHHISAHTMERQGAQKSSNPLKKLPRQKRHRIASQVKTGKTFSTDEVHPNLESSRKYGTANWGHEEGKPIAKPNTATVAELQDQILFYLNEYLVHETKGRILHRRFCEDFEGWTRPIWSVVFASVGIAHLYIVRLRITSFRSAEDGSSMSSRSSDASSDSSSNSLLKTTPRLSNSFLSLLPVDAPEDSSADRQEKEENLSEESASAQPELVLPFTEALSADPVDQTVVDHDMSVAIASKVNLTVPRENEDLVGKNDEETPATELPDLEDSPADPLLIALTVRKDHAADEVRDDPLQRRRLEDFEGDFPDAVADRDPAVNEPPTDLPDPPDIHRKRCEDPKEECSAKTPIKDR
ncbi:hypothetical protein E4U46_001078, partial [Claviceps purpurea]